ncbi:MAG: flavodoxin family protein [Candidatus Thermoplasmatota archaeon]|nr:flavodoxin family protein [Candidatus Thermoplasmatota archaeon]
MGTGMKVVAVNGSPRKKGNTQDILEAAAGELGPQGIEVEFVSLAENVVRPCTGCERCYKKAWDCPIEDDGVAVLRKMASANGLLVASPVYFGGVTAQLKALIDRSVMAYTDTEFKDKVAGGLSVGGGKHGGQELAVWQIATFCVTHDMIYINPEGGVGGAMATGNDMGDVRSDSDGLESAKRLGRRMAEVLKARRGPG